MVGGGHGEPGACSSPPFGPSADTATRYRVQWRWQRVEVEGRRHTGNWEAGAAGTLGRRRRSPCKASCVLCVCVVCTLLPLSVCSPVSAFCLVSLWMEALRGARAPSAEPARRHRNSTKKTSVHVKNRWKHQPPASSDGAVRTFARDHRARAADAGPAFCISLRARGACTTRTQHQTAAWPAQRPLDVCTHLLTGHSISRWLLSGTRDCCCGCTRFVMRFSPFSAARSRRTPCCVTVPPSQSTFTFCGGTMPSHAATPAAGPAPILSVLRICRPARGCCSRSPSWYAAQAPQFLRARTVHLTWHQSAKAEHASPPSFRQTPPRPPCLFAHRAPRSAHATSCRPPPSAGASGLPSRKARSASLYQR
jgi:hypothetical protein